MEDRGDIRDYRVQREAEPARLGEPARRIGSDELFAGSTELEILHAGAVYRLRMTRQGKLILNK